jgi:hypothetical protein
MGPTLACRVHLAIAAGPEPSGADRQLGPPQRAPAIPPAPGSSEIVGDAVSSRRTIEAVPRLTEASATAANRRS